MPPSSNAFAALGAPSDNDETGSDEDGKLASALQGSLDLGFSRASDGASAQRGASAKLGTSTKRGASAAPRKNADSGSELVRGRVPNVHWRAISLDELREHPRFRSLPPVADVHIGGPRTYAYVRQDTALWSELHAGALTSRHLLGVLGLCEPRAAGALGLPGGMVGHHQALYAYEDLREEAPAATTASGPLAAAEDASLATLNEEVVDAFNSAMARTRQQRMGDGDADCCGESGRARRRRPGLGSGCSISAVRCAWGSAQEASTLRSLAESLEQDECLAEAGLSMLDVSQLHGALRACARARPLPPIGASPDALLVRADGERETVEVKNVCPFVSDRKRAGAFCVWRGANGGEPTSSLGRGPHAQLLATHVPQVQLEMLCAGCRSGRLVSSSACFGVNEFRVERDDEYLALILHFIGIFYERFVMRGTPPPEDFFPSTDGDGSAEGDANSERALYGRLLSRTAEIARGAQLVRHIAEPWRVAGRDEAFFVS